MSLTKLINIHVTAEPPKFHPDPDGNVYFGVHISVDILNTEEEDDAKEATGELLGKFSSSDNMLAFWLYSIEKNAAKRLEEVAQITSINSGIPSLMEWLKVRELSFLPIPLESEEVEATQLRASHLIKSTAALDAPAPQQLGLTRVLYFKKNKIAGKPVILVPAVIGDLPEIVEFDTESVEGEKLVVLSNDIKVRTPPIQEAPTDPSGIIGPEGFLQVGEIEKVQSWFRLARRLEEESASLFWTLSRLLEEPDAPNHCETDEVHSTEKDSLAKLLAGNPEAVPWFVTAVCATALDPILIGLLTPGLPDHTEGHILSVFISKYYELGEQGDQSNTGSKTEIPWDKFNQVKPSSLVKNLQSHIIEKFSCTNNSDLCALLKNILALHNSDLIVNYLDLYSESVTKSSFTTSDANRLLARLRELTAQIQDESGAEEIILKALPKTTSEIEAFAKEIYSKDLDKKTSDILNRLLQQVFNNFKKELLGKYNGAEAIRRTVGQVFLSALTKGTGKDKEPPYDKIKERLENGQFFQRRLHLSEINVSEINDKTDVLAVIHKNLLKPKKQGSKNFYNSISGQLENEYCQLVKILLPPSTQKFRFHPDTKPLPLPIRIANETDDSNLDDFNDRFNGIGVLVKRRGENDENPVWSHANLVKLTKADWWGNGQDYVNCITPYTVHPFMPAACDGRRELFIEYAGFPLATQAFSETYITQAENAPITEKNEPYCLIDDIDKDTDGGDLPASARPPALAYGMEFSSCSFVVTKAGSLPSELKSANPWTPRLELDGFSPPDGSVYSAIYRRTTAIGRTSVLEADDDERRIGHQYKHVTPLSNDYPRTALSAGPGERVVVDLLRNADGTGGIPLQSPIQIQVHNLLVWGGKGRLYFYLHSNPSQSLESDDTDSSCIDIEGEEHNGWSIDIQISPDGSKEVKEKEEEKSWSVKLAAESANGAKQGWLRLVLTSTDTSGETVGISFADLEADGFECLYSTPKKPPLLLIARDQTEAKWQSTFTKNFEGKITLPRVGYLDWESWFNNPDHAAKLGDHTDKAKQLKDTLLQAYLAREIWVETNDSQNSKGGERLGQYIDALPDPAVGGFSVSLLPLDRLVDGSLRPITKYQRITPYDKHLLDLSTGAKADPNKLLKFLKRLDQKSCCELHISSGNEFGLNVISGENAAFKITANIPPGVSALLLVKPLVPTSHIEANNSNPLDVRMAQLAVGTVKLSQAGQDDSSLEAGDYFIFNGAELSIEAMRGFTNLPSDITDKCLQIKPARAARHYDIVAEASESDNHAWRQLSKIEVHTQAWRFSGRPIYHWIDPKSKKLNNNDKRPKSAAVPLPNDGVAKDDNGISLSQFEAELFFDRSDSDSSTESRTLSPGSEPTLLKTVMHTRPTASYFRHRFTYWSRYSGAMATGTHKQDSWADNTENDPGAAFKRWSKRVAMLADRYDLETLTRPQIRAYIPMSTKPQAGSTDRSEPLPLICVLEEPPFAHGGLADRVTFCLDTGIGWGFGESSQNGSNSKVTPIDLGREVGPDPRLNVHALKKLSDNSDPSNDASLGVAVEAEGPVGLSYDRSTVSVPYYANCQYLVRPTMLDGSDITPIRQEAFLGLKALRYLDPNWVFAADNNTDHAVDEQESSPHQSLWLQFSESGNLKVGDQVVCRICKKDDYWTVKVNREYLDVTANSDYLTLCRVQVSRAPNLTLLHRALSDRGYSLSILANSDARALSPADKVNQGISSQPQLIASIPWSLPETEKQDATIRFEGTEHPKFLVNASEPTSLEWARSARDGNLIYYQKGNDLKETSPQELVLRRKSAEFSFVIGNPSSSEEIWIVPYQQPSHIPRTLHRHLAAILTSPSQGVGRTFDLYRDAYVITGKKILCHCKQAEDINGVRLVEFQLPAKPIGGGSDSIPQPYKKVYLDSVSTGASENTHYHFHIRLACSQENIKSRRGVSIELHPLTQKEGALKQSEEKTIKIEIEFKIAEDAGAQSINLFLKKHDDNIKLELASICDWNGTIYPADLSNNKEGESIEGRIIGFEVTINPTDDKELWGDVSILSNSPTGRFNFDWLFTSSAGETGSAQATRATALRSTQEAQAQIIAWSSRIDLATIKQ